MKKLLIILLIWIPMAAFAQGKWTVNPLSGELEYTWNDHTDPDSLINIGYDNETWYGDISIIVGYSNNMGQASLVWGMQNTFSCDEDFVIGNDNQCNASNATIIGMDIETGLPGAIGFGMDSDRPTLQVHSGYVLHGITGRMNWEGSKGSVRIGGGYQKYVDTCNLEIFVHHDTSYTHDGVLGIYDAPASDFIATDNDAFTLDPEGMATTSFESGNLDCTHVPRVYSGASDTSLLPVPFKVGDWYIDINARVVYTAVGTSRGSWRRKN